MNELGDSIQLANMSALKLKVVILIYHVQIITIFIFMET